MNRIPVVCALGALLCLTPACSESEAATHAGTYELDSAATAKAIVAGMGMGEPKQEQIDAIAKGLVASLELKADSTFSTSMTMNMFGMEKKSTAKGTWTIKDGAVAMTNTHEDGKEVAKDKQQTVKGTIKDGVLTAKMDQEGKEMEMTFKKKKK